MLEIILEKRVFDHFFWYKIFQRMPDKNYHGKFNYDLEENEDVKLLSGHTQRWKYIYTLQRGQLFFHPHKASIKKIKIRT